MATSMIGRTQFASPNGTLFGDDDTTESGQVIYISEAVPSNQTNLEFGSFAFLNSKLKAFAIHATQDCSVFTNEASTGTPQEKFYLKAGKSYVWSLTQSFLDEVGASAASPFDGDVTKLFVTNTTALTLTVMAVVDPT